MTRPGLAIRSDAIHDMAMEFTSRIAAVADADRLRRVMDASIRELQKGFLTDEQIESSRAIMGIDHQLIADGTYFVVEHARTSRDLAVEGDGVADHPGGDAVGDLASHRGGRDDHPDDLAVLGGLAIGPAGPRLEREPGVGDVRAEVGGTEVDRLVGPREVHARDLTRRLVARSRRQVPAAAAGDRGEPQEEGDGDAEPPLTVGQTRGRCVSH